MKSALCAGLWSIVSLFVGVPCRAEIMSFQFEFKGFERDVTIWPEPMWEPDRTFTGFFSGEDRNNDETISRDELTKLVLNNRDYFNCGGGNPDVVERCTVSSFQYSPWEVVKFEVGYSYSVPFMYSMSEEYQTFNSEQPFFTRYNDYPIDEFWWPTLETSYSIMPTIPEPSILIMLGIGLGLLGAVRRLADRATNVEQSFTSQVSSCCCIPSR